MASFGGHAIPDVIWKAGHFESSLSTAEGGRPLRSICLDTDPVFRECSWDSQSRQCMAQVDDLPSGDSDACSDSEDMSDSSPRDCSFELLPVDRTSRFFPLKDPPLPSVERRCRSIRASQSSSSGPEEDMHCTLLDEDMEATSTSSCAGRKLGDLSLESLTLGDLRFLCLLGSGAVS
jgi:hypothetical protein